MKIEYYPLSSVSIGTTFKDNNFTNRNVIKEPITTFSQEESRQTFMSGTSKYLKTEHMNKGSLGVSGSYGVNGLAKFSFAVSGYYGNAASKSGKSVEINHNIIAITGKEFLNVDELKLSDLFLSLSSNVKEDLETVLDNFLALKEGINSENYDISHVLEHEDKFNDWIISLENFFDNYGDGFVVAVHWGAFGNVKLEITSDEEGNKSNYGGELEGSYEGIGGGTTVKAAYDGSQSANKATINVVATSSNNGSYVLPIVEEWRKIVEKTAADNVANFKFSEMSSNIAPIENRTPKIPEFKKKETEKTDGGILDKLDKIKDVKGLEAFAKAQAYSTAAKKFAKENPGEKLSLDKFLIEANKTAENEEIDRLIADLNEIDIAGLPENEVQNVQQRRRENVLSEEVVHVAEKEQLNESRTKKPDGFVAIGASLCNWADLFPWLARGIDNSLTEAKTPKLILQWRTMIQDAQALANMYYMADLVGLTMENKILPIDLANAFKTMQFTLQSIEGENPDYTSIMQNSQRHLSEAQKLIYKTWCNNKLLRTAELGLGYLLYSESNLSIDSIIEDKTNKLFDTKFVLKHRNNSFEVSAENFQEFSSNIKLYPIIFTDGKIGAFSSYGYYGCHYYEDKSRGIESSEGFYKEYSKRLEKTVNNKNPYTISHSFWPITFTADVKQNCLEFSNIVRKEIDNSKIYRETLRLFPIPLAAANGVQEWKGQASGGVSLNSFTDLKQNLMQLQKELSGKNKYSYSSDSFKSNKWRPNQGLTNIKIPEYYVGIQPDLKNSLRIFS